MTESTTGVRTLCICIPTYKRPALLARCLDSIIRQADGLPLRVYVCDDSCSDINDSVMAAAMARLPAIRYERNPRNLGINENIRKVIGGCGGDVAWPVGEDDFFLPGALARACREIQAFRGPFVMCNYAFVGDDDSGLGPLALSLPADIDMSAEAFIAQYLWATGFMGACLIDVAAWHRVQTDRYRGTWYAHVGHIVEMLGHREQAVRVIVEPMVANRATDRSFFTWRAHELDVLLGFERMCARAAEAVPDLAYSLRRAALVWRDKQHHLSMRSLARMRADGAISADLYQRELKPIDMPARTRLYILLLCTTPRFVFRAVRAVKQSAKFGLTKSG